MIFKANCDVREIVILQIVDNKNIKILKKYRQKTRIKKGERFILESFDWKPPSMRKGLFRKHKSRSVTFNCSIVDEVGLVSEAIG